MYLEPPFYELTFFFRALLITKSHPCRQPPISRQDAFFKVTRRKKGLGTRFLGKERRSPPLSFSLLPSFHHSCAGAACCNRCNQQLSLAALCLQLDKLSWWHPRMCKDAKKKKRISTYFGTDCVSAGVASLFLVMSVKWASWPVHRAWTAASATSVTA